MIHVHVFEENIFPRKHFPFSPHHFLYFTFEGFGLFTSRVTCAVCIYCCAIWIAHYKIIKHGLVGLQTIIGFSNGSLKSYQS